MNEIRHADGTVDPVSVRLRALEIASVSWGDDLGHKETLDVAKGYAEWIEKGDDSSPYADALDSIACAVETATDDTLRDGIRSMIRRARPEALKLWQDRVISTINQRDKAVRQR